MQDVINTYTGEIVAKEGDLITRELADAIQNTGIESVLIDLNGEGRAFKVISNKW